MLQHTLDRLQQLVPAERTVIVVGAHQSGEASRQLSHWPQENIIYQPANRDTAPGILLPFSYITHRDPSATVIVSPSDHFVRDENRFMDAVAGALADLKRHSDKMILLGMTPEHGQETEYGYIQLKESQRATLTSFNRPPCIFHGWATDVTAAKPSCSIVGRWAQPSLYGSVLLMFSTQARLA